MPGREQAAPGSGVSSISEGRAHALEQLVDVERLRQHVMEAVGARLLPIEREGAEEQDGRASGCGTDAWCCGSKGDIARAAAISEDEVRPGSSVACGRIVERGDVIDMVGLGGEQEGEQSAGVRVFISNEQPGWGVRHGARLHQGVLVARGGGYAAATLYILCKNYAPPQASSACLATQ